jgi:hypothetical protein
MCTADIHSTPTLAEAVLEVNNNVLLPASSDDLHDILLKSVWV